MSELPEEHPAVAVVGMSGRFPGAGDVDALWRNVARGVESISFFGPDELAAAGVPRELVEDPSYVPARGTLDGLEDFDAAFFAVPPREAELLSPAHRLFLECAWQALEHAACDPRRFSGAIALYAGAGLHVCGGGAARPFSADALAAALANDKDFLATRVSYKLDLRGPSLTVQTACSTSLVAVHLACQSLLNGECDLALAGGVSAVVPQRTGNLRSRDSIFSSDGHCRAFAAAADGTVASNGAGVVVLKLLADAAAAGDTVYAAIRGTAINNDGAAKLAFTAPSEEGQAAVIRDCLAVAGVEPETIGYVEAHGTGTALGDPVEVAALTRAFGPGRAPGSCALGSLKTNLGHLDAAAGVAGLIKTVLALYHRELPPSLHFDRPNPRIDFAATPFYVNAERRPWPRGATRRRAGVSSFGIGGTNAHVVLEEAPERPAGDPAGDEALLVLSARTAGALERASDALAAALSDPETPSGRADLADVAHTLLAGRRAFAHRRILVARDRDEAAATLRERDPARLLSRRIDDAALPDVAFLLPGQGAQRPGMGRGLYAGEPIYRRAVDESCEILAPHLGLDLRQLLHPVPGGEASAAERLRSTELAQPALFVVEHALARLFEAAGARPAALVGHSLGEYVAACLADVLRLEDALALVALRGRLVQELPPGAMLSVPLPAAELAGRLHAPELALAAANGPAGSVAAGTEDAVAELARELAAEGLACRRLRVSHAFHSPLLEPILEPFAAAVAGLELQAPRLPYLSNVTGDWITPEEATDPGYWARHLRATVRFGDAVARLLENPDAVFLEVGPGHALSALVRQQAGPGASRTVISALPDPTGDRDREQWLTALGRLWLAGCAIESPGQARGEHRLRVALPTYPFERRSFAAGGASAQAAATEPPAAEPTPRPALDTAYLAPRGEAERAVVAVWEELLGFRPVGVYDSFLELGGDSLLGVRMLERLGRRFGVELTLDELFAALTPGALAATLESAAAGETPIPETEELEEGEL